MTRLLEPIRPGLAEEQRADGFLSRLAKFIPSETGTLFTVVNAYLLDELGHIPADKQNGLDTVFFLNKTFYNWAFVVFMVCFVGNIILLYRMYEVQFRNSPYKTVLLMKHLVASSVGFFVWAYAIKSPLFAAYYHSFFSVLLIGFFLILVSSIKPPKVE